MSIFNNHTIVNYKDLARKIIAASLCVSSVVMAIKSSIPVAKAATQYASEQTLGTRTALGSPLINTENFSTSDWNKWETICWGVYLSNFCQPLIDSYKTAFKEGFGGSNGIGFKALWGGSGNDSSNLEIIETLCDYAIDKSMEYRSDIYVTYTGIQVVESGDGSQCVAFTEEIDPNKDSAHIRKAAFRDLWFRNVSDKKSLGNKESSIFASGGMYKSTDNTMFLEYSLPSSLDETICAITADTKLFNLSLKTTVQSVLFGVYMPGSEGSVNTRHNKQYDAVMVPIVANVPTFWIEKAQPDSNGNKYTKILDYRDWWDCQIPSMISNSLRNSDNFKKFTEQFKEFWNQNGEATIKFDAFGNIVCSGKDTGVDSEKWKIVIPAAINQHITEYDNSKPTINLINSWIFNSYISTYDDEQIVCGLRQDLTNKFGKESQTAFGIDFDQNMNGFPAFGKSNLDGVGLMYYDLDSIMTINEMSQQKNYNWGDGVLELFSCDIDRKDLNLNYPLKFEISGSCYKKHGWTIPNDNEARNVLSTTCVASSMLPNLVFGYQGDKDKNGKLDSSQKNIMSHLVNTQGEEIQLFDTHPIAVSVKPLTCKSNDKSNEHAVRDFFSFLYKSYSNQTSSIGREEVVNLLKGSSWEKFKEETNKSLYDSFLTEYPIFLNNGNLASEWRITWDYGNNETITTNNNRLVLVYPVTDSMASVSSILGVRDGTEFSVYCTYIYMTYLDYYGVSTEDTLLVEGGTSRFSKDIYENRVEQMDLLITDFGKSISKYDSDLSTINDIDSQIAQMSYLMLEPEKGRSYRKKLVENSISDFVYEQYNRLVYGGSGNYIGTASKSNSGFLSVESYSDNFLTSPFLDYYVDIAVWLLMGCIILAIIIGLFKHKKLSWYILTVIIIINTILIIPSTGEIVPYVTSSAVQKMYSPKMTFWSISEGITNSSIEYDSAKRKSGFKNLSEEEAKVVVDLVSTLSTVYTDCSLSVKQDISQKVTQYVSGTYSNIQNYQSARWILPMVMQQFSGDKGNEANYIYKPLANIWTDLSNVYWYFNPFDAVVTNSQHATATSGQKNEAVENSNNQLSKGKNATNTGEYDNKNKSYGLNNLILYNKVSKANNNIFKDFDNTGHSPSNIERESNIHYRCYSYTIKKPSTQVHLVSSYLPSVNLSWSRHNVFGDTCDKYDNANSWSKYTKLAVKNSTVDKAKPWRTDSSWTSIGSNNSINDNADSYNRNDRTTVSYQIPYLLTTESPIYYFYNVVKDSFPTTVTIGQLINRLQGEVTKDKENNNIRHNFMYATKIKSDNDNGKEPDIYENSDSYRLSSIATGYVRDILDLEEMFRNTIPYLYQMEMVTGGFDGDSGILIDDKGNTLKISSELNYYEGEKQSWIYRCNWATKIMENPSYSKPAYCRTADGKKHLVNNPLLPESYPREMVFSEAQKNAMGLSDGDLTLVELKCIEVNKEVSKQWTLLINYASTKGITKEVLMRQMATDATMTFSREFSSTGIIDTTYELHPQSLDLRYLSFDVIAKMLVLNASQNTSYIYGDTMSTVIDQADLVTAILLLFATLLSTAIIPFLRMVLMAIIFYLGFLATIRSLFANRKYKAQIMCGQIISNLIFMFITLAYFGIICIMTNLISSDEVLSVSHIKSNSGNPLWLIFMLILLNIAYGFILIKQIYFCFANRKDMGYEAYSIFASGTIESIQSGFDSAKDGILSIFSNTEDGEETTNTKSIKGTVKNNDKTEVTISNSNTSMDTIELNHTVEGSTLDNSAGSELYNESTVDVNDKTDESSINAEIEAGRLMGDK